MSQIVHITFEKLTGLRGEIEGWFECDPEKIDIRFPLVFNRAKVGYIGFSHQEKDLRLYFPANTAWHEKANYVEHFRYGTNFLIKKWSYGSGVDTGSKNPN